jgi:hypothetical protein
MIEISNEWKNISEDTTFEFFSNLSEKDKRIHHLVDDKYLPLKTEVKVYRKEKNVVVAVRDLEWKFAKNRFFVKSKCRIVATVTPKRIFSDNITQAGHYLARYLGFHINIPVNRILFRKILNEGQSAFEEYRQQIAYKERFPGPIEDVKIFVEGDLDAFAERVHENHELRDLYHQAVILDKKIKLSWSDRKIHDLHMKWTEEIHKIKCRNCSKELIWQNIPQLPKEVELLNSEMRIAEEGHKMHHCIYTNYLNLLERKTKIAFHANDFTVMFNVDINGCTLNQAYKAWNKALSKEEMDFAKSLVAIADNIVTLNAENIVPTQNYNTYQHNGVIDDDFAF